MTTSSLSGRLPAVVLLYLLFFLSGLAALVYEVVWVRSLGLVFGGSHLAVTTVLTVFMGGLALGGSIFGARADRARHPLRLYAVLEIGIALSATAFLFLVKFYPLIYTPLARLAEGRPAGLTVFRVALASIGMLIPTTLMGGTLPVLTRLVAGRPGALRGRLGPLYAFNTLGAVAGALAAGFLLLPWLGARGAALVAVAVNVAVGAIAWFLPERLFGVSAAAEPASAEVAAEKPIDAATGSAFPFRLVLAGIGVSGFCALGYEIIWTRVLTLVLGTSVYSFTILLAAFLAGIATGGECTAILGGIARRRPFGWRGWTAIFGATQILIGVSALAVTWGLRDLPLRAVRIQEAFRPGSGEFGAQQAATFIVAFAFLAVPACFMGIAFPVAGNLHAMRRGRVGRAVGETLAVNTVGAILGAAVTGFVLVYRFGFERSLQLLVAANLGTGALVLASLCGARARRPALAAASAATAGAVAALALAPGWGRVWDRDFFAVFRNNQYRAFDTEERVRDALANTEVLYYFEGTNETISVIRPRGAHQAFIVNGRVEASTTPQDRQCQRTLGHLPMLAHPDPKKVFVLGTGTGMTLGAVTIHPEAEAIVLVEIEPGVLPAARTFAAWNHRALDNPKVRVVIDDGRNFLQTTRERFDVITADPIHPWSGGASYLYTDEYFRLAAGRLEPGGVIGQWLPIYELDADDLRSVVRTFANNFPHVALWLTHYDAEILGSDRPIVFDPAALGRRIGHPPIREDLEDVFMGTADDFLAYRVAGTAGLREFSRDGVLNTDDNLWLEFHSPKSRMIARLPGDNVAVLTRHRELLPGQNPEAVRVYDRAHALFLHGRAGGAEFAAVFADLRARFPEFPPGRFLAREVESREARLPVPRGHVEVRVRSESGGEAGVVLWVVTLVVGPERGVVMVVDNAAREVYGERYVDAPGGGLEPILSARAGSVLAGLRDDPGARGPAAWRERVEALLRAAAEVGEAPTDR